jgi:hypothetical protein
MGGAVTVAVAVVRSRGQMFWTEVELHRWTCALDLVASESENIEEAEFYGLWLSDVENSPPATGE